MPNLHHLLNDIPFEFLPPAWTTFDLASFSRARTLWDYQQDALRNAIKALWKYYDDFGVNKQQLIDWYLENQIELDTKFNLGKKRENASLLSPYYPITDSRIPYSHFINRMGFWMATGSGKTLVIVKMLELLWQLIQRGQIPAHDVMMLTHREDLLQQLRDHVNDFNASGKTPHIQLRELRDILNTSAVSRPCLGSRNLPFLPTVLIT